VGVYPNSHGQKEGQSAGKTAKEAGKKASGACPNPVPASGLQEELLQKIQEV
jgi:hypothetical protein